MKTLSNPALQAIRVAAVALVVGVAAHAAADPFPGADLAVAKQTHAAQCVECHAKRFGGEDGSEIYTRFDRRVTTPSGLAQQLTACTTMLNLDLFPEDEHHLAGYLNTHYYKFQ
jgi:cytochrome c553